MSQTEEQQDTKPAERESPNVAANEKEREVTKHTIRRQVWEHLERNGLSSFPRPVYGRIPNFKGCEEAAAKLSEIEAYKNCKNIEVNPDKPQESARILALENGKTLYVPVPRLKEGLLKHIGVPEDGNRSSLKQAVSRKGIEESGKTIGVNDSVHIDLLVVGSVAVSKEGYRIGKGRGYADLEYAILREMGAVDENTIVVTNVHDSQVFDTLPKELFQVHDVPIDYILTPTEVIEVTTRLPKPPGIIWNLLSQRRVNLMPVLQALKEIHQREGKDTSLKEVDTDVESYEPRRFSNRFKRFRRRRPRSLGGAQGDGDVVENAKLRPQRQRKFFRRRPLPRSEERPIENGNSATGGENEHSTVADVRRSQRPRRPFRRNRPQIDFSLMVSNIEKSVRVRDLKNALIERGIKPNDITWRGYKGFCYLHYAKPNSKTKTVESYQVDNVIEILQNMKISPDSELNLSVKVMEPISRIETTDVTAV